MSTTRAFNCDPRVKVEPQLSRFSSFALLPIRHTRLGSGGWPALPDRIDYLLGSITRFQLLVSCFLLVQACLAHPDPFVHTGDTPKQMCEKYWTLPSLTLYFILNFIMSLVPFSLLSTLFEKETQKLE
jgi:hypothetical protein